MPLKDEDLIHLGGITSVEVLTLSSGGITDDGLAHLSGLKLRHLRLESPWISGAGRRHVGGMTDLWCLVLNSPRLDSLLPLGHLTELRWVGMDGTAVGDADMVILARSKGPFHFSQCKGPESPTVASHNSRPGFLQFEFTIPGRP